MSSDRSLIKSRTSPESRRVRTSSLSKRPSADFSASCALAMVLRSVMKVNNRRTRSVFSFTKVFLFLELQGITILLLLRLLLTNIIKIGEASIQDNLFTIFNYG